MVEKPSDSGIEESDNLTFDDSKLRAGTANTNLIQVVISWREVQEVQESIKHLDSEVNRNPSIKTSWKY